MEAPCRVRRWATSEVRVFASRKRNDGIEVFGTPFCRICRIAASESCRVCGRVTMSGARSPPFPSRPWHPAQFVEYARLPVDASAACAFEGAGFADLLWLNALAPHIKIEVATNSKNGSLQPTPGIAIRVPPVLDINFRLMKVIIGDSRKCQRKMHLVYTPDVENCVKSFRAHTPKNGTEPRNGREIRFNRLQFLACLPLSGRPTPKYPLSIDLRVVIQCGLLNPYGGQP